MGNRRQAEALASALGLPFQPWIIEPRAPWSWFAPRLLPAAGHALPAALRISDALPCPPLVIGCGRIAALATRLIGELSRKRCRTVQILDPRIGTQHWDWVIAPRHDRVRGSNVITTLGSLHAIDSDWLADSRDAWRSLAKWPAPRIGVLIGGPRKQWALDPAYARALVQHLKARQQREGGSVLAVVSRRTPAATAHAWVDALQDTPGFVWTGETDGRNPYPGVLAWADRLVVTPDSVNMLSEACATGRPVHTFGEAGLGEKLSRFHAALREQGMLHGIDAVVDRPQKPLREAKDVARQLREHLSGI